MSFNFGSRNERYFFLCSFKSFVRWCSNFSTARNIITLACIYALCFFSSDSLTLNRLDFFNWNANQNATRSIMKCTAAPFIPKSLKTHPTYMLNSLQTLSSAHLTTCTKCRCHSVPIWTIHHTKARATMANPGDPVITWWINHYENDNQQ